MKKKIIKENENNDVNAIASLDVGVDASVITNAVVIVENVETPALVEKKKRGRKKLIKPDLSNANAANSVIISGDNSSHADPSAAPPVVVHKKRGRKPRGGKIIQENLVHNNNVPELPNIILHLKCVTSDLNASNGGGSIIGSSDTLAIKHDNEIMCYNDQTVCGSEVCNYTDSSSTDSADSDSPITATATINDYQTNNNNNKINTFYDPSTFTNCCSEASTCDASSSTQLFTEWKDKHKHNYQHDDSVGDSENNATMKDIWKKIAQLKINYNKNDTFQIIGSHRSACFWCTCDFDTPAIYIPKLMVKDTCNVYGCFCHPECAVAFLMNENIDTSTKFERYHLLNSMYGPIYNYDKSIKPAPNPYYLLNKFYGNLSITEYRKLFKSEQLIYMVNKPLTHILPELYEDNNDFLVGNKIIQNNNIRKNQLKKKSNKTNIINEVFGVK
jgi:hypothetical protein